MRRMIYLLKMHLGAAFGACDSLDGEHGKIESLEDKEMTCRKSQSALKSMEVKFKLVEEFNATTTDDQKAQTAVTLENGTLIQKQAWDGRQKAIEQDGMLTAKRIMDDVVAHRTHLKAAGSDAPLPPVPSPW